MTGWGRLQLCALALKLTPVLTLTQAGQPNAEDCVHSCLPGPVDTYATLLVALLNSTMVGGSPSPYVHRTQGRFFDINRTRWLSTPSVANRLERKQPRRVGYQCLAAQGWWPFHTCKSGPAARTVSMRLQCASKMARMSHDAH